jgi:Xaa-Pro dipeptidase
MTIGVGGTDRAAALNSLSNMMAGAVPIALDEYQARIAKAQGLMREQGIAAIYVNAGSNLTYFTGTQWKQSERMVGAIIPAVGAVEYIAPAFEEGTVRDYMVVEGHVNCWHEHESPYALFLAILERLQIGAGAGHRVGLCESSPFFIVDGIAKLAKGYDFFDARVITAACRTRKSANEIALMQRAHDMTLAVHRATASMLYEGITTTEVEEFINEAHRRVGSRGSYFCIVLFGPASAFPHGVKNPQVLKDGDVVLIDTGCLVHGYMSDITRTYVFGEPSERQRWAWNVEKAAQAAAFAAARLGTPCGDVDIAARRSLEAAGLGPDYALPGLPHRTGHGIGLDVHEWPYLVRSDRTPLAPGMCFSNEPMICFPGEFGIRHEDHFYMTEEGPKWFTQPSHSVDDPFGLQA